MATDWTLYGIITLALAVLGVLGTFVAPHLVGGARIVAEILNIYEFRRDSPSSSLNIQVLHNGQQVDRQVFVLHAAVENAGNADVVQAHFVDPIEFRLPQGIEVLSVEASAPEGVGPRVGNSTDRLTLSWKMLKPRERIQLRAIIASEEMTDAADVWASTSSLARLINVKTGHHFWQKHARKRAVTIGVVVALAFLAWSTKDYFEPTSDLLTVERSGVSYNLQHSRGSMELCELRNQLLLIEKCRDIDPTEAMRELNSATLTTGWVGQAWFTWVFMVGMAALNGYNVGSFFRPRRPGIRFPKEKRNTSARPLVHAS